MNAAGGMPDGAGMGRDLTIALVTRLVPLLGVPLTVELEGGHTDDPAEVAALAEQLGVPGVDTPAA